MVVLDAGEALFLRGGDDFSVNHQSRGAVMVKGRDAKNGRQGSPPRYAGLRMGPLRRTAGVSRLVAASTSRLTPAVRQH